MEILGIVCVLIYVVGVVAWYPLTPCEEGYFEMVENRYNSTISCTPLRKDDTVTWFINKILVGRCPPPTSGGSASENTCVDVPSDYTFPVRTSTDSSSLTFDQRFITSNNGSLEGDNKIECIVNPRPGHGRQHIKECRLDLVYPSDMEECTVKFVRWAVLGSCNVKKMYSAQRRYGCYWNEQRNGETDGGVGGTMALRDVAGGDSKYKAGTCSPPPSHFPTEDGFYTYRVLAVAGNVSRQARFLTDNQIERPRAPSIWCNATATSSDFGPQTGGFWPENTKIVCTCNTTTIGRPEGRLMGVVSLWRNTTITNDVAAVGKYGEMTLVMEAVTLRSSDVNVTFQCDVNWAVNVSGEAFTVTRGYAPTAATLVLNSSPMNLTVKETQTVEMECRGEGGQPQNTTTTTLRFENSVEMMAAERGRVLYVLEKANCQSAGRYHCAAGNAMGPAALASSWLFVNCKPRRNSTQLPSLNYQNQSISVTFDVIAYPVPDDVTFAFLGQSRTKNAPQSDYGGVIFTGSCSEGQNVYTSVCTLTLVEMTSATSSGFYQVLVSNSQGSGTFWIYVKYNGCLLNIPDSAKPAAPPSSSSWIVIIVAVLLAVVVMSNVVVVVWVWRRSWILPCADTKNVSQHRSQDQLTSDACSDPIPLETLAQEDTTVEQTDGTTSAENSTQQDNHQYIDILPEPASTTGGTETAKATPNYVDARSDNDSSAIYTEINDYQAGSGAACPERPYDSLRMSAVGQTSEYSTIPSSGDRDAELKDC